MLTVTQVLYFVLGGGGVHKNFHDSIVF